MKVSYAEVVDSLIQCAEVFMNGVWSGAKALRSRVYELREVERA